MTPDDIYRYLLEETAPDRKLYVAVGAITYKSFFNQDVIQLILHKHQLPLIVVDTQIEEITQLRSPANRKRYQRLWCWEELRGKLVASSN
ncbi:element excision factor XisH family protein [Halotia wernerae UHCC 0503]|nr:element excision factor XisH family protein [Halotia wernerae UHCC 0503]